MKIFTLFAALLASFYLVESIEFTPIRRLKSGQVRGAVEEVGNSGKKVEFYEGIKFGKVKRFEKPQPADSWTGVYDATRPRTACPSFGHPPGQVDGSIEANVTNAEDCLYLNIWRPIGEAKAARPVMVWIHGGAFEGGSIFSKRENSANIALTGDLVVVALSYRLGPLGFLTGGGVPGNLGLHDQIRGLTWIKENIHSFGGDPNQVTIFGESAGSMSVASLVISPLARGLFHRAIAQSGAPTRNSIIDSPARALLRTKEFAKKANCSVTVGGSLNETIQCLKGKSVAELQIATINDLPTLKLFLPVYGDELLPIKPTIALQRGQFNPVDYIYGVTNNEGNGFLPAFFPELAAESVNLTVQAAKEYIIKAMTVYESADIAKEVADFYVDRLHNPTSEDLRQAIGYAWGDSNMVCPSILFGEELAKRSPMTKRVYSYRLMQSFDSSPFFRKWMGVTHGSDIAFIFAQPGDSHSTAFTKLSQSMILDWVTFARTGRPHSPVWTEAFNRQTDDFSTRFLHLEAGHLKMVKGFYKENCEKFWKPRIFV